MDTIAENPEEPLADGRGKSPGSRKTQFQAGHDPRRSVRRKAERKPDTVLLLKRMRRDARKGDLRAFESRLAELELLYARQTAGNGEAGNRHQECGSNERLSDQVQALPEIKLVCWFGCRKVVSVPASVFDDFRKLKHNCGAWISLRKRVRYAD